MQNYDLELSGLEELREDIEKAVKLYPDKAQETLEGLGKAFKKRAVKETKSAVFRHSGNLQKGYKLGKVQGYRTNMELDFWATAPHFHLIENGHNIVLPKTRKGKKLKNGGKITGFVPGRLILHKVRSDFPDTMKAGMETMCKEIFRECGLS